MKFYQVMSEDDRKVFKSKAKAKEYIEELLADNRTDINFDCMFISINSDTILDILNGNGYCSEIIVLN